MSKRIVLALLLALCFAATQAPFGVLAASHAKPPKPPKPPKPEDVIKELQEATKRASLRKPLRDALTHRLDDAKKDFKRGDDAGVVAELQLYIARLEQEKISGGVAPDVADELIALAQAIIDSLDVYPYAGDYERVPIVGPSITPLDIDWRSKGIVTPVKTQGQCDSDWAFSAGGAIEGAWALSTGTLLSLSEQQLVDCAQENMGCGLSDGVTVAGSPVRALEYVIDAPGIARSTDYPYTGIEGTCKAFTAAATIDGLRRPVPGDEEALGNMLGTAPVSVVLHVRTSAWDDYVGPDEIEDVADAPSRWIAGLLVGYEGEFWIVKMSYGPSWGRQGYARIRRGSNAFGIADFVVAPTL